MDMRVVGVDCAVQPKNIGVALARWDGERCRLGRVVRGDVAGAERRDVARFIAGQLDVDIWVRCTRD